MDRLGGRCRHKAGKDVQIGEEAAQIDSRLHMQGKPEVVARDAVIVPRVPAALLRDPRAVDHAERETHLAPSRDRLLDLLPRSSLAEVGRGLSRSGVCCTTRGMAHQTRR